MSCSRTSATLAESDTRPEDSYIYRERKRERDTGVIRAIRAIVSEGYQGYIGYQGHSVGVQATPRRDIYRGIFRYTYIGLSGLLESS